MKNIDFLPDVYRQARAQRSARRWWCSIAALLALAILTAVGSQWLFRRHLEQQLAHLAPQYAQAVQREAELALVREEIVRAEEVAQLQTYLVHPWPRTQLLASIVRPLPASIRLNELTVSYEALATGPPLTPLGAPAPGGRETRSPAVVDLAQLRAECDGRQAVVSVVGIATVQTELHAYVDRLGKSPLIAAAHLKGVEAASDGDSPAHARFHLHIVVAPGYGQPDGPPRAAAPSSAQLSALEFNPSTLPNGGAP